MADGKRRSGAVEPLDGGWGWVIIGCCFMVTVCTRAVTRCISIFFVEFQAHFGADYAATAWIHSLVDCTTMLCAPVGSLVGNRWSCRVAVMLGGLLSSVGLLLSSFTTSLELLYLTLGVLTGLGFALCYTPAIAMVGCYFHHRRALAFGIAMSGSGIGTFVLAPVVQMLIELYSWRGALLVLSAFVANLCVCGALLRPIKLREEEEEEEEEEEGEEAESVGAEKLGVPLPAAAGLPGLGCVLPVPGQRLQPPLRLPGAVRSERRGPPPAGRLPHVHPGCPRHRGEHHLRLADGPEVSEAVPSGVLRLCGGDGGSLLSLHAVAPVLLAPRTFRRPLRLLRRCLRGADPRGDGGHGGSSVPVLGAGCGLLPPRHPLPHQPANRRLAGRRHRKLLGDLLPQWCLYAVQRRLPLRHHRDPSLPPPPLSASSSPVCPINGSIDNADADEGPRLAGEVDVLIESVEVQNPHCDTLPVT